MIPLFASSGKIHYTNLARKKKEWQIYMNLGNIFPTIRTQSSNLAWIVVALVPVPQKYHFTGYSKLTAAMEQQFHNWDDLIKHLEYMFRPLNTLLNAGRCFLYMVGHILHCYTVICAWSADYFENIHLHLMKRLGRFLCEALKSSCGEQKLSSW